MDTNSSLFERARGLMPGGVNSPVRAFGPVGGTPPTIASASGAQVVDVEGREYIDYVGSWGPMILGHAHPKILEAVAAALSRGTSFGAPTRGEIELAELIVDLVPSAEMVRLTSSGTEAAMSASRLMRGVTGRSRIVKFAGCYHGHADSFLVSAGSGAASHGEPSSPGVPDSIANLTLVCPYNDLDAVRAQFDAHGADIAGVIVEPIAGNMGLVPPKLGFLEGLRELTTKHGAILGFDEVMTGFRVHPQSAQGLYGVMPDITCLGKIVGGGLPVGAVCGSREVMENFSPTGPVYQAGTLSGNPLSVAAGAAQLRILRDDADSIYAHLESIGAKLEQGWHDVLEAADIPHVIQRVGSMVGLYFSPTPVENFDDAQAADSERFKSWFHGHLERGVYMAPSPYEAAFVSTAHTEELVQRTVEVSAAVVGV